MVETLISEEGIKVNTLMLNLRTPKGTTDYKPKETMLLNDICSKIIKVYQRHGATSIDTPTFELTDILTNKYGDDSKLIFNLQDQGGDICSLRYDLTVSFARYLAQNKVKKIKRYQLGKVFRRDQPAITKGRYREFMQCDFDIAGDQIRMTADAEIIKISSECLDLFGENYLIKINHRKMLGAIFSLGNIDKNLHNTICSTVDKIDKMAIDEIRKEFMMKGLDDNQIFIIERYVKLKGNSSIIEMLKCDQIYKIEDGKQAIDDLEILVGYLKIYNILEKVEFDLSLARGTDYYTGIIFEAVYRDHKVGAVLGGGRYDDLAKTFDDSMDVPCIGFSVGIARIYSILVKNIDDQRETHTDVFVASSGGVFLEERMKLVAELWNSGICAETYFSNLNFRKQASFCVKEKIPFMVILGDDEICNGYVQITRGDIKADKAKVARNEMVEYLKKKINSFA